MADGNDWSVWVKLVIDGDETDYALRIKNTSETKLVDDLKDAIVEKAKQDFDVDIHTLTIRSAEGAAPLRPNMLLSSLFPSGTTYQNPLVVTAKSRQNQLALGTPKRQRLEGKIDDATQTIFNRLICRQNSEGVVIEVQASADAAKLVMDANPLEIPVTQDELDFIEGHLASDAKNLTAFAADAHVLFVVATDAQQMPTGLMNFLTSLDFGFSWTGETEDEVHAFVEAAVTAPINKFFNPTFRISRNKAHKTSSCRADYSISSGSFQLFRGEDKMRNRVSQENPQQELLDKSPKGTQWITLYGPDVPYIFGYYTVGETNALLLQMVCIKRDAAGVIPLTQAPFDLTKFSGMFGCRCFMFALLPHLLAIKENIKAPVGSEWKISRDGLYGHAWRATTVYVILDHDKGDCCLAKDFYFDINHASNLDKLVGHWTAMFDRLPESPHLMKLRRVGRHDPCPEDRTCRVRCVFAPFCQPESVTARFPSAITAKLALLHVSKAVETLHIARMVHNDVRWPNVVRAQGADVFVLVDYDDMSEMDDNGMVPAIDWMDVASHAPDITREHNHQVDIWGICKMMTEIRCNEGNVADIVSAGKKWLHGYPSTLPISFHRAVDELCSWGWSGVPVTGEYP